MKVLIAYDGSECASDALEDLKNAGLPAQTEALVVTVTENWTMILENKGENFDGKEFGRKISQRIEQMHEQGRADFAETQKLVKHAAERIRSDFQSWQVREEALPGFVPWGLLEKTREWKPDLIVVGSHGRGLVGRFVLGSTSLKVLTESACSVRVARCSEARTPDDDSPQRIVIGFDGSRDSMLAVEAAAKRAWRQDSAARLVTAVEPFLSPIFASDLAKAEELSGFAAHKLEAAGLHVSTVVPLGEPKNVLVEEAEKWGADAIFVGAQGHRLLERFLLGSVSYAVAARAHCSVEVVRDVTEDEF